MGGLLAETGVRAGDAEAPENPPAVIEDGHGHAPRADIHLLDVSSRKLVGKEGQDRSPGGGGMQGQPPAALGHEADHIRAGDCLGTDNPISLQEEELGGLPGPRRQLFQAGESELSSLTSKRDSGGLPLRDGGQLQDGGNREPEAPCAVMKLQEASARRGGASRPGG